MLALATNPWFGTHCEPRRWILVDVFGGRSSSDDNENNIMVFWVLRVISNFARVLYIRLGMYRATVS